MSGFRIDPDLLGLEDTVAVVTGGAAGVGRGCSVQLARAGCHVAVVDVNAEAGERTAAEIRALGRRALFLRVDVRERSAVQDMVAQVVAELGGLDVMVSGVGHPVHIGSVLDLGEEQWDEVFALDIKTTLFCAQAAAVSMVERGVRGRIVNVSSSSGIAGAPTIAAYGAAKAGVIHLTKSLALEYGRFNIRSNIVLPGTVRTPLWQRRAAKDPTVLETLRKWYPLGRIVDPEDVAQAVAFLASDAAAAITGIALPVDCGLSAGNIVMARELTLENF